MIGKTTAIALVDDLSTSRRHHSYSLLLSPYPRTRIRQQHQQQQQQRIRGGGQRGGQWQRQSFVLLRMRRQEQGGEEQEEKAALMFLYYSSVASEQIPSQPTSSTLVSPMSAITACTSPMRRSAGTTPVAFISTTSGPLLIGDGPRGRIARATIKAVYCNHHHQNCIRSQQRPQQQQQQLRAYCCGTSTSSRRTTNNKNNDRTNVVVGMRRRIITPVWGIGPRFITSTSSISSSSCGGRLSASSKTSSTMMTSMSTTTLLHQHPQNIGEETTNNNDDNNYQDENSNNNNKGEFVMVDTRKEPSSLSTSWLPRTTGPELVETTTTTPPPTNTTLSPRERRRKLIGLAKAVDRGDGQNKNSKIMATYQPGIIRTMNNNNNGSSDTTTMSSSNQYTTTTATVNHMDDHQEQPSSTTTISFQALSGLPNRTKRFVVFGIESSCDDTGVAIIDSYGNILGEALASQHQIHEVYGGVVPGLARDAHVMAIEPMIQLALQKANISCIQNQIDAIGVTVGPGLEICLRVGLQKAMEIAIQYNKPFVAIHHLEAHILMARLMATTATTEASTTTTTDDTHPTVSSTPPYHIQKATATTHEYHRVMDFPFLVLLVSGGHCQLLTCHGIGEYTFLGGTIDDSLGEAYDKTARLLGLPVGGGGGPALEQLAQFGNPTSIPFTIPMRHRTKDCDFSFSGLKTNVRRYAEQLVLERNASTIIELPYEDKANIAASFQHVAIQHVEQRVRFAMDVAEQQCNISTLAVVGGVAANQVLRKRIETLCQSRSSSGSSSCRKSWNLIIPPPRLCTDQGSMSAWAAIERIMVGSTDDPVTQQVYARYPFVSRKQTKQRM